MGRFVSFSIQNDILLVDGAREIIGMGLNKLGYSLNDKKSDPYSSSRKDLHNLAPQVRGIVGDEIIMMLQQNEGHVAVVWSGLHHLYRKILVIIT